MRVWQTLPRPTPPRLHSRGRLCLRSWWPRAGDLRQAQAALHTLRYTAQVAGVDQLGFSFRPPERRVWTVRELVSAVRTHIESEYCDAWVEGEISNLRAQNSGHL